jgi:hypothetical protein
MPTYLQFEDWVRANIPPFDDAKIAGWNEMVRTREKPAEKAAEERAEVGVPDLTFCEVVLLNDMVDWKYHHDRVRARRAARALSS